tara:strand:+ start:84 stop:524 length:441 start_codon:yes stop_codon:yes gene_type:complete
VTPPTVQFIPAAAGSDWDDLDDGISYDSSHTLNASFEAISVVTSSINYSDVGGLRVVSGGLVLRDSTMTGYPTVFPPYVGLWTTFAGETNPEWRTYEWNSLSGFQNRYTLISGNNGTTGDSSEPNVELALILLSSSVLPTGWTDYA